MPAGKKVMHLLIFCFSTGAAMHKNASAHTEGIMQEPQGTDLKSNFHSCEKDYSEVHCIESY